MRRRRGRRIIGEDDDTDEDEDEDSDELPGPSRSQTQNRRGTQKSQVRKKPDRSLTQNSTRYDDDDDYLSQSQLSQSRTQKGLAEDELNRLMGHVVRYLLVSDRTRHPILRANIQKSVLNNSKHFRSIMEHAKTTLKQVFGYELVDIDSVKYILVNEISNNSNHISFPTERSQMVLLFICLSHIFMSEEICSEDNLWNFLRKLNIVVRDDFKHPYFGDVMNLITVEFVKQKYLIRSKIENADPEKFQYEWGTRAERELDKLEVLNFVSKVYRNKPVQDWASQLKSAQKSIIRNSQL